MDPILLWSFLELSHQPKVGFSMHVATLYSKKLHFIELQVRYSVTSWSNKMKHKSKSAREYKQST